MTAWNFLAGGFAEQIQIDTQAYKKLFFLNTVLVFQRDTLGLQLIPNQRRKNIGYDGFGETVSELQPLKSRSSSKQNIQHDISSDVLM